VAVWFRGREAFARRGLPILNVRKGKRGGPRYLYLYLQVRQHIHLFFLFGKNEGEDVTERERQALLRMADAVVKEGEGHA